MKSYSDLGTEIGELVERKNAAYGSSFEKAGEFLALLYPEKLTPEQYGDALLLVRIFDKQMRIATDRDALGESPFMDIAGYGILGAHMHQQQQKGNKEWLNNANYWDAQVPSRDVLIDTAVPSTNAPDTTSGSAKIEHAPSKLHASCSDVPTAMDAVPQSAEDQRGKVKHECTTWLRRNNVCECVLCSKNASGEFTFAVRTSMGWIHMRACSQDCLETARELVFEGLVEGASI